MPDAFDKFSAITRAASPVLPLTAIERAMGRSAVAESAFNKISELQRATDSMRSITAMQETMGRGVVQSALDKFDAVQRATESLRGVTAMQEVVERAAVLQTSFHKVSELQRAVDSMHRITAMQEAMGKAASVCSTIDRLSMLDIGVGPLHGVTAMQEAMVKGIARFEDASAVRRTIDSLQKADLLRNSLFPDVTTLSGALEWVTALSDTGTVEKLVSAISASPAFRETLVSCNFDSFLESACKGLDDYWAAGSAEAAFAADTHVEADIALLEASRQERDLITIFKQLSPGVKAVLLYLLRDVLVTCILTSLLTPYVEKWVASSKTATDQIRSIKKIPLHDCEVDASDLRFITRDGIRLRSHPRMDAAVVDDLQIGQVLEVVSKSRNWIQVRYSYEEEAIVGWVNTRYTARFKFNKANQHVVALARERMR